MAEIEIFDRNARRRAWYGAIMADPADRWLQARMVDELHFRLGAVTRGFEKALLLGPGANMMGQLLTMRGIIAGLGKQETDWPSIICEEDRLEIAAQSVDLVIATGGLDSVNDLPGALIQIRRALKPGGLFLGAMMGAGTLANLRRLLAGDNMLRAHPQIDVRAAGDLLARAGFALPVADADLAIASYPSLPRLLGDIRANALGNCLKQRRTMGKNEIATLATAFDQAGQGERFIEHFAPIYLTGWSPEPASEQ